MNASVAQWSIPTNNKHANTEHALKKQAAASSSLTIIFQTETKTHTIVLICYTENRAAVMQQGST